MSMRQALNLVASADGVAHGFKVHDLTDNYGTRTTLELLREESPDAWLWTDIKGLDTVDTIKERAKKLKALGFNAMTVHALGKPEMIKAAVDTGLFVISVTLLSDWSDDYIRKKFGKEPNEWAIELALDAKSAGTQAIVCSPTQIGNLANQTTLRETTLFIVPGTRSQGKDANDQKQVDTPYNAIVNGADYLVIGRQATKAQDPAKALEEIATEIAPAIGTRIAAGTWWRN